MFSLRHSTMIEFEIIEEIAVLSSKGDWTLELNIVSWNGKAAKYDLRSWSPGHEKMSKGITFTEDEARILVSALREL